MINFATKLISEIDGKIKFYKLIKDNKCEFDEFWSKIEKTGNLNKELINIQAIMQQVADMQMLPKAKFRNLTPNEENIKEYEIKTKNLRVYLFHNENKGRIIVCGGKKTSQKKDIKHFRNIKKLYFKNK